MRCRANFKTGRRRGQQCDYPARPGSCFCMRHKNQENIRPHKRPPIPRGMILPDFQECIICCDEEIGLRFDDRLPCGHKMHIDCVIKDAILNHRLRAKCPLCRKEFSEIWEDPKPLKTRPEINEFHESHNASTFFQDHGIIDFEERFRAALLSIWEWENVTIQRL